jgi:hypothetical protein
MVGGNCGGTWRVEKDKKTGGYRVCTMHSSKDRAHRWKLSHANEVADYKNMGWKPPQERKQCIRDLHAAKLINTGSGKRPWQVVTCKHGVVLRKFKIKFKAVWWLQKYQKWRELKLSRHSEWRDAVRLYPLERESLDRLVNVWLISDREMDREARVAEIAKRLREGRP